MSEAQKITAGARQANIPTEPKIKKAAKASSENYDESISQVPVKKSKKKKMQDSANNHEKDDDKKKSDIEEQKVDSMCLLDQLDKVGSEEVLQKKSTKTSKGTKSKKVVEEKKDGKKGNITYYELDKGKSKSKTKRKEKKENESWKVKISFPQHITGKNPEDIVKRASQEMHDIIKVKTT